jgi:hypothetical protein
MSRIVVGVVVLLVVSVGAGAEQVATPCATAVVARACDHGPAPGVSVKIVTVSGWSLKSETDQQGRAEFDLCVEDIAKLKVGGVRSDRVTTSTVVEEVEGKRLATITVGICES